MKPRDALRQLRPQLLPLFISLLAPIFGIAAEAGDAGLRRDAELVAKAKDPTVLKQGKAVYLGLCQGCHGNEQAKGDSPSNLFDAKWYHGGRPSEIEHTILKGVIEKNMPGWGEVLSAEDTTAVTAYLISQQKA